MKKLKSIIEKLSSPKIIAFHFIIFLLISLIMHFIIGPKLIAFTVEMQILDKMILGYDLDYVNKFLMVLEEKGRNIYLYQQIATDMVYPFAYGGFLCFSLAWLLKKRNHHLSNNGFIICLLPLIGIFLDLLENTSIAILLLKYPNINPFQVGFSSTMTCLKYLFLFFSALFLLLLFSKLILKKITNAK
tara:strand:+ start:867 stop:1430 length:564 start_codon:yes stop_codon:yes gene_type:complete